MWVQTAHGIAVPLDGSVTAEHIDPRDIAHSLAMQCRFNGHTWRHYSVAEHSAHVASWLWTQGYAPSVCMAGLMHDAAEAYIGDIVSPMKRASAALDAAVRDIERPIQDAIRARFWCAALDHRAVKEADDRILVDEQRAMFSWTPRDWGLAEREPLGVTICHLDPIDARDLFVGLLVKFEEEMKG